MHIKKIHWSENMSSKDKDLFVDQGFEALKDLPKDMLRLYDTISRKDNEIKKLNNDINTQENKIHTLSNRNSNHHNNKKFLNKIQNPNTKKKSPKKPP